MQPRSSKEYMELMSPSKRPAQMRNEITSNERLSSAEIGESPHSPKRGLPKSMDQPLPRHSCSRGSDRFPSQMIPQVRKRPRDNDEIGCSVCELCEPGEVSHAHVNSGLRHVHGRRERELVADRRTPYPPEYGRSDGKLMALEEGELPTSYCEICASEPSLTQGSSRCLEHLNRRPLRLQSYEGRESRLLPRDTVAVHRRSHLREFPDYARRGIRRASTMNSRGPFLDSYEDDESLPPAYEYLHDGRSSKSVHASTYRKKVLLNSARNPSVGQNNSSYHSHFQQSGYHSPPDEFEEYPYIKQQNIVDDSSGYPSNNIRESMAPHSQEFYKHSEDEDYHADMSRPYKRRSALERLEIAEGRGDSSKSSVWKRTSMQKHSVRSSSRTLDDSQQGGKHSMHGYVHADYERRQPQNLKAARLGSTRMESRPHANSENRFEWEADFGAYKERYSSAGMNQFRRKTLGIAARRQIMEEEEMEEEEDHMYLSSERLHREKHCSAEHLHEEAYNRTITRKPNTFEYEDLDGSEDFSDEEDEGDICFANSPDDEPEMGKVTYRGQIHKQDFVQEDPLSFQDKMKHEEMHSMSFSRYQGKTLKSHHKSGPVRWYSNHGKSGFHRNQNAEMSNHGTYYEDDIANEFDPSKDRRNHEEPALDEESDEFKQLVQEYFLRYSKRININSAVQRRYQSQGKAGSLFCVVCGRRFSKEFLDTDRLVKHTFMAKRHWLRARHLGLHRAICVSLGWSSRASVDTPTAPPVVLPQAEAFALKADLIIWPPVFIIHNMSMVIESPEDQKVVSVDTVKAFLRGKGFADGKMVICLGNPVDQSVMVVKFLGTFTGLRNAMKLQDYFAENNHGRVEFVDMVSRLTKRKSSEPAAGSVGEHSELEELNLYGYLGIAEDLDKVDFKTRKFCEIKSNKEIDDFENAPVKAGESEY